MTTLEENKAKQMIEKFLLWDTKEGFKDAKQCAVNRIDEILKHETNEFLENVKIEIIKYKK